MNLQEIESAVIECLTKNLELSGEAVPRITKNTKPASDLSGFDSLRVLEVVVSLEEKFQCDISPEKVFFNARFDDVTVSSIAIAIDKILKGRSQ